jgi:hypothetical protein
MPALDSISLWMERHGELMGWLAGASVLMFVGSLLAMPWLLARMPEDYFLHERVSADPTERWRPLWVTVRVLKNLAGIVLLLMGITMLVLPGQGILTMLIGISMIDFPGKRRLELNLIRRPRIYRGVNWLRRKAGHPPLKVNGMHPTSRSGRDVLPDAHHPA